MGLSAGLIAFSTWCLVAVVVVFFFCFFTIWVPAIKMKYIVYCHEYYNRLQSNLAGQPSDCDLGVNLQTLNIGCGLAELGRGS
jgi:hypothetical protein